MSNRYPSAETVAAFGGTTRAAEALGLAKSTIHRWKQAKSGLIPRWWSDQIKAAALVQGVKLPRIAKQSSKRP